ncbi:MAG: hypothetical protein GXO62_03470 [Epsilonproteobacteria bacterium]|nr:hypothetical protein [Campylobacterota bacterium]
MRGENFIYFATVSGFFIGVSFSIFKGLEPFDFLFATALLSALFYLIALGSVAFFVKFVDIKQLVLLKKDEIDSILDMQIAELEKKEDFILENYEFIKKIEEEELQYIKKQKS